MVSRLWILALGYLTLLDVGIPADDSQELHVVPLLQLLLNQIDDLLLQDFASLHFTEFHEGHVDVLIRLARVRSFLEQSVQVVDLLDVALPVLLSTESLHLYLQLIPRKLNILLCLRCDCCQILNLQGLNRFLVNLALLGIDDLNAESAGPEHALHDSLCPLYSLLGLHVLIGTSSGKVSSLLSEIAKFLGVAPFHLVALLLPGGAKRRLPR